ncbi:hypothetical protein [Chryseobacterium herbae]|uniref:Cytochrome C551 n=1 Tax=Chryseobacterium herbae TaxID=2976476 RepID=A0ABT2IY83_9FLAO|nr:hypothetical protein [Chryseobacterium sp. pc1-10]MCT2563808.1 hypothetical protein [Chryseobacterium sp. pc1-10]
MKFSVLLMVLGLTVLSCKKETKANPSTKSDSVVIDTIPSDMLPTMDSDATKKMDTVKAIKK